MPFLARMQAWDWIAVWVAGWSVAAFTAAWMDKRRAQRGRRRLRESTLLAFALAGGIPGLALGMIVMRHKTRKTMFLVRLLVVVLLQAGALCLAWRAFK